jgi:hypothetical protein
VRALLIAVASVVVTLAPAAGSRAATDPAALVRALVTTPIRTASLPAGLETPRILRIPPSDNSKQHHAVGTVDVIFGSGEYASLVYDIFPTRADAVADYRASRGHPGDTTAAAPDSFPKPSKIVSGSIVLNGRAAGISAVEFVDGNVIVLAAATSTISTHHGDIPGAVALARFGVRHLGAVRSRA